MEIKELKIGQNNVNINLEVIEVNEPREFERFGKLGRVAVATVKDKSGKIKLTLWNDQIDKIKIGDKIKLTNGFVKEFQGEKQLTSGRFGKIEVEE